MAGSDPVLREQILLALQGRGTVKSDTLEGLKQTLGMQDVSNTKFSQALRSLHYKYRLIDLRRPRTNESYFGSRGYEVTYRTSTATRSSFRVLTA